MGGSFWAGAEKKPVVVEVLLELSMTWVEENDLFNIVLPYWKLKSLKIKKKKLESFEEEFER